MSHLCGPEGCTCGPALPPPSHGPSDLREAAANVLRTFELKSCDGKQRRADYSACDWCDGEGEDDRPETIVHEVTCSIGKLRAALASGAPESPPQDYNFAKMYGDPDDPESRAMAHYLELQIAGNAPRTLAEHEQYQRWRAHDPAIIALRARLEEATRRDWPIVAVRVGSV